MLLYDPIYYLSQKCTVTFSFSSQTAATLAQTPGLPNRNECQTMGEFREVRAVLLNVSLKSQGRKTMTTARQQQY